METEPARRKSPPLVWNSGAAPTRPSPILVAIALMFLLAGCANRELQFQTEGTQGNVGRPMNAGIILDQQANGCGGHAAGSALLAARTLPRESAKAAKMTGYSKEPPTQPGHWNTQVTLIDLVCNGPHPDQTLPLEFDISP
jgi:hypothetical protein